MLSELVTFKTLPGLSFHPKADLRKQVCNKLIEKPRGEFLNLWHDAINKCNAALTKEESRHTDNTVSMG